MSDNLALPQGNIAEIETERSKKVVEIDKKEKEKDKAEEDQQFVIDGAILECKMCMVPIGTMKVNFDTPTIQNKKTATVKEKSALSLKFSGNCLKSPYQASPCMAVMQLGEWQNVGTTLVQDQKPLIKKSTIMCNYGGSTIKITKSGQLNVPSSVESIVKNKKEILSIQWMCDEVKDEIQEAKINDKVSLLVKTKNYKEGDAVFVDVTEEEGGDVKNGSSLVTFTGKVKADGTAELKETLKIENL